MKNEELVTLSLPYYDKTDRTVRVYVPAHNESESFPVIYMTDGQNLFDEESSTMGCWHTREAVKAEYESCGKAAIIVGIHNDGHPMQRTNELTPGSIGKLFLPPQVPEELRRMADPQGEKFDDFLINTVMPAIEARFPIKPGRENTAVCGSSSGGLQMFYTGVSHPDIFSAAGAFSPCFMLYEHGDLANWINSRLGGETPFLYLFAGGVDEIEEVIRRSTEFTYGLLKGRCPGDMLKLAISPECRHRESSWEVVFKDFLHIFLNK